MKLPSIKQKKVERTEGRERKRNELEVQYESDLKAIEMLLSMNPLDLHPDDAVKADWFRRNNYSDIIPKDKYVEEGLRKWEDSEPIAVSGTYRDQCKLSSQYQQKFVELHRGSHPQAFEELRDFVPLFLSVFQQEPRSYSDVLDRHLAWYLIEAETAMYAQIRSAIFEIGTKLGFDLWFVDVRPGNKTAFDFDFTWGRHTLMFELLNLFNLCDNASTRDDVVERSARFLTESLVIEPITLAKFNESSDRVNSFLDSISRTIVHEIARSSEPTFFVQRARQQIEQILNPRGSSFYGEDSPSKGLAAFVELHVGLLRWLTKWGIGKDWVLRYTYYFLGFLAENPEVQVLEVPIPRFEDRSLFTDEFQFRFDRWFPGDESRENFESRAKQQLDKELEEFFQAWGRQLNLDKLGANQVKRVKNPINPEFDQIKWLIAWNDGSTYKQIAATFNRERQTIIDGINGLESFALPRRSGQRGRPRSHIN